MLKQKITGVDNGGGMILRERPRANIELLGKLNTKLTNRPYVHKYTFFTKRNKCLLPTQDNFYQLLTLLLHV